MTAFLSAMDVVLYDVSPGNSESVARCASHTQPSINIVAIIMYRRSQDIRMPRCVRMVLQMIDLWQLV